MSADRTVTTRLVADTAGYDGPITASAKLTGGLKTAQQEAAAAAKAAAAEHRATAQASAEASARSAEASRIMSAAEKEARAAAKDASAAQLAVAKAATDAERAEAVAVAQTAAARDAAAKAALTAAQQNAVAAKDEASAATQANLAARANATALRDQATAAKDAAVAEAAEAKTADEAAKKRSEAYTNSGKLITGVGLGLVAAFGIAEKATSDFEKSMSGVAAVANATAPEMEQLRTAALQAGKDTAFSAKEAADAEGELVRAGVSVKDVLGGALSGTLALAAAGQLSLADAAVISANAMNTFGLAGKDVAHIADVLAAGANKSAADVKELSYGLQQGGLVAAQTGLTLEDTTAVLAAFADRGLKGADAGTSMKTMLERLNNPTSQARDLMMQLGISAYDTTGKFVGIQAVAGQLHDKMASLTDAQRNSALATIFGSDAIRGATVLYSLGADGMKGYVQSVNDQGAASRMASEQLNNLSGDLHQLKGSLDTALIQSGGGANTVLRDMTQAATAAVNAFDSLPKPVQEAVTGFAGGAGSALLLVGGMTSIAGKAAATRKTLSELATTAEGMKGALASAGSFMAGPWGLAIAGAATVIGIFASKTHEAKAEVTDFTSAIKDDGNALGDHTREALASELASKGLYDQFGKLGVNMQTVTDAALGNADALKVLGDATAKASKGADPKEILQLGGHLAAIQNLNQGLHDQLHAQQQTTAATAQATATTADAAKTTAQAEQQAKNAALAEMQHAAAVRALNDAQMAKKDTDLGETAAVKAKSSATTDDTAVTNAATTAKHAQTSADKSATLAARDAGKAVNDHAKVTTDATKATNDHAKADQASATASKSAADAAKVNADATATATAKHKADAQATKDAAAAKHADAAAARDAAAAARDSAHASDADTRASDASATAADKAGRAHDAATKAAEAKQKALDKAAKASADEAEAQRQAAIAAQEAADEHKWGTDALKGWSDAAAHASDGAYKLDDAVSAEVGAMKDAKSKANDLKDALDALNGVHIAASKAAIDVQSKIHDLNKTLTDNGNTLDITTEKGRANMTAVLDLAQAINQHAQSVTEETGSVKAGNDALAASRDEFDKVLAKAGLAKGQIDDFNKTLLNTPALSIDVDTTKAMDKLRKLKDQFGQTVFVTPQGVKQQFSHGGLVTGRGTDTSDNIPIQASPGEWVVTAAAARAVGYDTLARINATAGVGGTIVRPHAIGQIGGTTPQPAIGASGGPALHIENFHAGTASPGAIAAELGWRRRARGGRL